MFTNTLRRPADRTPASRRGDAPGPGELVGDLDARGRGSDDEHAAGRQRVGAAVGAGRDRTLPALPTARPETHD